MQCVFASGSQGCPHPRVCVFVSQAVRKAAAASACFPGYFPKLFAKLFCRRARARRRGPFVPTLRCARRYIFSYFSGSLFREVLSGFRENRFLPILDRSRRRPEGPRRTPGPKDCEGLRTACEVGAYNPCLSPLTSQAVRSPSGVFASCSQVRAGRLPLRKAPQQPFGSEGTSESRCAPLFTRRTERAKYSGEMGRHPKGGLSERRFVSPARQSREKQ